MQNRPPHTLPGCRQGGSEADFGWIDGFGNQPQWLRFVVGMETF
jgi:hypothetical protein